MMLSQIRVRPAGCMHVCASHTLSYNINTEHADLNKNNKLAFVDWYPICF